VRKLQKVQDKQIIIYNKMVPLDDKNLWKQDFLSVYQWEITEKDIKIPSWKIEEF